MNNTLINIFDDFLTKNNFWASDTLKYFGYPKVNIYETDSAFELEFFIPGVQKDDVKVEVEDNTLTVSYEHQKQETKSDKKIVHREYGYRKFSRSFKLGDTLDADNIQAKFENGVLQLSIAKKEELKPAKRLVEIA